MRSQSDFPFVILFPNDAGPEDAAAGEVVEPLAVAVDGSGVADELPDATGVEPEVVLLLFFLPVKTCFPSEVPSEVQKPDFWEFLSLIFDAGCYENYECMVRDKGGKLHL